MSVPRLTRRKQPKSLSYGQIATKAPQKGALSPGDLTHMVTERPNPAMRSCDLPSNHAFYWKICQSHTDLSNRIWLVVTKHTILSLESFCVMPSRFPFPWQGVLQQLWVALEQIRCHWEVKLKRVLSSESPPRKKKNPTTTERYGFYNLLGWRGGWLQLDAAKKRCQFKYKTAIMLLHIHKVLLRAYHSMQSTLPCHHGSRGALQQQWGGENFTWRWGKKKKKPRQIDAGVWLFDVCYFVRRRRQGRRFEKRNEITCWKKNVTSSATCVASLEIFIYIRPVGFIRGDQAEHLKPFHVWSISAAVSDFFFSQDDYWGQARH